MNYNFTYYPNLSSQDFYTCKNRYAKYEIACTSEYIKQYTYYTHIHVQVATYHTDPAILLTLYISLNLYIHVDG